RGRSPVLPAGRRLGTRLLLLLCLHIPLFSRRTAEQLIGLVLSEAARRLRRLFLRRGVGLASGASAAPSTTATRLLFSKRELVVPLRVEVREAHEEHLPVRHQRRIERLVGRAFRCGETA